jgi:hypothetical protein
VLNILQSLVNGSYIVAFLNTGTDKKPSYIATANSGALFFIDPVPLPPAVLLFASGLVTMGVLGRRRRRNRPAVSPA